MKKGSFNPVALLSKQPDIGMRRLVAKAPQEKGMVINMGFISGTLLTFAKGALTSAIGPFVEEARDASLNAAEDTVRGVIMGKMSAKEWADIVIGGVDTVKERIINEENLRFVGGKLKFTYTEATPNSVKVSFQLYFLDETGNWQKAEADSGIPFDKFKFEDLEELKMKKEIIFEVE